MLPEKQISVREYQKALGKLKRYFNIPTKDELDSQNTAEKAQPADNANPQSLSQADSSDKTDTQPSSLKELFLDVLFARDDVFSKINPDLEKGNYTTSEQKSEIIKLAESDASLYQLGRRIFQHQWIDLSFFRQVAMIDSERWWWQLDIIHFDDSYERDINLRIIIQFLIALVLLIVFVPITISLVTQLSQVILRIFIRVEAEQLGLDIITFIAIGVQILISGRITVGLATPLTNSINRTVLRRTPPNFIRRSLLVFFPLSRILVASAMFALIILATNVILSEFSEQIFSTVRNVEQPLASRQSVIESTGLLRADADFGVELTLIGINLEQIGNINGARLAYRQALETKATLIYAAYRLADTYIEVRNQPLSPEDEQLIFDLLDSVTQHIQSYRAGRLSLERLTVKDDQSVILIDFLTLTSRAELFLRTHRPTLARDTVEKALTLVRENPGLFVINDNLQNSLLNSLHLQPPPPNIQRGDPPLSDSQARDGDNPLPQQRPPRNPDGRNLPDNSQQPISNSISTNNSDASKQRLTRILYIAAQTYQILHNQSGQSKSGYGDTAQFYWREFISHADERIVQEQLWLSEARNATNSLIPNIRMPDLPIFNGD